MRIVCVSDYYKIYKYMENLSYTSNITVAWNSLDRIVTCLHCRYDYINISLDAV